MKSPQAIQIILSVGMGVMALPSSQMDGLHKRNNLCTPPGPGKCAVLASTAINTFGGALNGGNNGDDDTPIGDGDAQVAVVGNKCENVVESGTLQKNSPGFSADFTCVNGNHVYFGASELGFENTGGIRFQYLGKSYTQSDCAVDTQAGLGIGVQIYQCDFPC